MRITFVTRKFGNVERNSHCDVLHITPIRVARLFLDCNGVFAIKAYRRSTKAATSERDSIASFTIYLFLPVELVSHAEGVSGDMHWKSIVTLEI